jgi:DNA-binding winged helix-turn-helix (wHTH) protein/tetratricopeptide (TPR) repeat protein
MTYVLSEVDDRIEQYEFDGFHLFPKPRTLWRDGTRIPLMPKSAHTLTLLVKRAGETVTKEDLLAEVWNGVSVEENNLTQCISTLRKMLGEKRGENRYIATDPGRGYRFVAPVILVSGELAAAPVVAELPDAPFSQRPPAAVSSPGPGLKARIVAAVLGLLVIALGSWLILRHPPVHPPLRRSVAVLRFRDLSKATSEAWLQTALSELLTSELASGGKLRTIPAEDVARWHNDLGISADEGKQAVLWHSAQRNLGADNLVVGSYVVTGSCPDCRVRVDLSLVNAASGERFGTVIEEGSGADVLDLASRLGKRLRAGFGIEADVANSPRWPAGSAMREYAEGVKALHSMDPLAARNHLESAAAADPENALIHAALADAWTSLGYGARATEENRRAFELSDSLDRLDRLGIEARYRSSIQQWDRAVDIYKTICQLFPDSLDDGLNLADAQMRSLRAADAKSTLRLLRALPEPAGRDPRIDLSEARTEGVMNNYRLTRDLAHRAAEEAKLRGARYLFARARLLEGGAMQNLGDPQSVTVQTEARLTCEQIGDRACVSAAWRILGNYRFYLGDFASAQRAYEQGVAIARDLGNRAELANLLEGFGAMAQANRDWARAEQNFREAISLRAETGYNTSGSQITLAELYLQMGRFAEAGPLLEAARTGAERAAAHEDLGEIFRLQAQLARMRGDLDRAQRLDENAVAEIRLSGSQGSLTLALADLSSVATVRGDLRFAERNLTEAGASDSLGVAGEVELARTELWLAEGRFSEAGKEAERSAATFDKAHADDRSARAFLLAADALEMLHRDDQALAACRESQSRAARAPGRLPIALAKLCEWRLGHGSDQAPADVESQASGIPNPELALASAYARATRAKRTGSGNFRRLFEELAGQAASRGYVTLSKRAQSLGAAN